MPLVGELWDFVRINNRIQHNLPEFQSTNYQVLDKLTVGAGCFPPSSHQW